MTFATVAVLGLLVGSFTNVLISRVPADEDWVRGSSRCPRCGHEIHWRDNIPLLSWLLLRGSCRHCGQPISRRYPLVELLVSALFVAVYLGFGLSLTAAALGYLACVSTALAFIDLDVHRLPDPLVLPSYGVVGALLLSDAAVTGGWGDLARAGAGAGILGGFYLLMWLAYPAGMGFGDVKTAGLLGLALGYAGWPALAVGGIAGPLTGGAVVAIGLATRRLSRRQRVPYGPMLIVGAWLGVLAGAPIASAYVEMLR